MGEEEKAEFMSVEEVANLFAVTTTTVRRMANAGELPWFAIGKRLKRFKRTDIEAYIARARRGGIPNGEPTNTPQDPATRLGNAL